jgi:molecular chaperone HtpG
MLLYTVKNKYKTHRSRLVFPWRNIDDSNVETEGFLREAFEFTIDQAKILDLLTGHTLYNDSQVVIRELVQNSLDAIRLQKHQDPDSPSGHVQIT